MWNSKVFGDLKKVVDNLSINNRKNIDINGNSIPYNRVTSSRSFASENLVIETHFSVFWVDIFLYAVPKNLVYYPNPHFVLGCNVKLVLDDLVEKGKNLCSHPPGYYHQRLSFGKS